MEPRTGTDDPYLPDVEMKTVMGMVIQGMGSRHLGGLRSNAPEDRSIVFPSDSVVWWREITLRRRLTVGQQRV